MQNTAASVADAGLPGVTAPAAEPFSVMVRQAALPKAAERVTVHVALARAEVPCRVRLAGCARGERREAHLDHTDMRAVDALAASRGAGMRAVRAARQAVTRVARRAGRGALPARVRAAVAGAVAGADHRAGRGALRTGLPQVAGEVRIGVERDGRLRGAGG